MYSEKFKARFWAHVAIVNDTNSCWLWQRYKTKDGYGIVNACGVSRGAHRVALEIEHGVAYVGGEVMHSCDNPGCVRPSHLRMGTHLENLADMKAKGRARKGERHLGAKLTEADVLEARGRFAAGRSARSMAKEYGVDHTTLMHAIAGRNWAHVA
jgi:hypothetical protein